MNVPEPHELFILPEGHSKVEELVDTKLPHSSLFTIYREDHTVGTVVTSMLLKQKTTLFAAYKVPHPLEHNIQLKIQTTYQSTPKNVLISALEASIRELNEFDKQFMQAVENYRNNIQDKLYR